MNKTFFQLEIISPTSNKTLNVEWLEVESPTGSFFVGPGHSPLVSIIKKQSDLIYKTVEKKETDRLIVVEGFFRINSDNKAIVILTS